MSRLDDMVGKTREVFDKFVGNNQASPQVKSNAETPASKSEPQPEPQVIIKEVLKKDIESKEMLNKVMTLLEAQEALVASLADTVKANDAKLNQGFDQQEDAMTDKIAILKEDNKQCMSQLKDVIMTKDNLEVERMEDMMKVSLEGIMAEHKAHTLEVNRTLMSLKTSLEGSVEAKGESILKDIKAISGHGKGVRIMTLIIVILNFLGLAGYIAYDILL